MAQAVVSLLLRILTFVLLLLALIVLTTNTSTFEIDVNSEVKLRFTDISAYRYLLSTIVISLPYIIAQIVLTILRFKKEDSSTAGSRLQYVEFYGDRLISFLLATGAAAGFAVTKDLKPIFAAAVAALPDASLIQPDFDKFFAKGYATSSLVLIAFLFTAASSILSSLALIKRD